jgi:hypothetical protein
VRALVTTEQGRDVRGRIGQRLREDNPLLARLEPDALGEFERLVQQLLTPPRSAP